MRRLHSLCQLLQEMVAQSETACEDRSFGQDRSSFLGGRVGHDL